MTKTELLELYFGLDSDAKALFLARLSNELTIWMRAEYEESTDCSKRAKRLMGANELQHHISSELRNHLLKTDDRYPDEVLMNILLEKATYCEISEEFQSALIRTAASAVG
jgi:hypothetical protein